MYDSVNFKRLLPCSNYAPGCVLPPHLSPFVVEKEGDYVTPDKAAILEAFGEGESKTEHVDTTTECSIGKYTTFILHVHVLVQYHVLLLPLSTAVLMKIHNIHQKRIIVGGKSRKRRSVKLPLS